MRRDGSRRGRASVRLAAWAGWSPVALTSSRPSRFRFWCMWRLDRVVSGLRPSSVLLRPSSVGPRHSSVLPRHSSVEHSTQLGFASTELGRASTQLGRASTQLGFASTQLGRASTQLGFVSTEVGRASPSAGSCPVKPPYVSSIVGRGARLSSSDACGEQQAAARARRSRVIPGSLRRTLSTWSSTSPTSSGRVRR